MKNHLFSVVMVLLLMFNMIGYSIYNLWNTNGSSPSSEMTTGDFVIIKVPADIPHLRDINTINEKEIFHDNNYYQVIDKHIASDTLYLHCEFNQNARERFWNLVNSLDLDDQSQSEIPNLLFKNILKEYVSLLKRHYFFLFEWSVSVVYNYVAGINHSPFHPVVSPPPIDRIC